MKRCINFDGRYIYDLFVGRSEAVTVGRSRRLVSVVLDLTPTNTISRRHAEIAYRKSHQGKDTFAVKDLVGARHR